MKKIIYSLAALMIVVGSANAKHVDPATALKVATNFMYGTSKISKLDILLIYTAKSTAGVEDYYAFNYNDNTGFVIVSADDVAEPIIGYSTEGPFVAPVAGTNFAYWMGERQKEMEYIRANNLQADAIVANKWAEYLDNISNKETPPVFATSVSPLCAAKWGQTGTYNDLCPGGSMAGCVATAMTIIMKKWAHPTKGTGSSSYNSGSYGTLSANYGATTYNWAAMTTPYCSGSNTAVATITYHCGVAVQMNYSPSGSGAQVIGGNPSAQYAYKTYFGYNPTSIKGLLRSSYQDAQWIQLLKDDLDKGQPIQYAGVDASAGGHTWVCDGYDATNKMHMNWGWNGSSNGYFGVNNMAAGGFDFSSQHQVCIGIVPGVQAAVDAGIPAVFSPAGTNNTSTISPVVSLKNWGTSPLTSCKINYKVDNGGVQNFTWTGSLSANGVTTVALPSMTVSAGAHTFTCYTSNPNNVTDGNTTNDQTQVSFSVLTTGLADLNGNQGFSIYPNPATSHVTVEGTASGNVRYSLYDIAGAEVRAGEILPNGNSFNSNIQVSELSKGMYFLRITDGNSSFTKILNKQ